MRGMTQNWFVKQLKNGIVVPRTWLMYSPRTQRGSFLFLLLAVSKQPTEQQVMFLLLAVSKQPTEQQVMFLLLAVSKQPSEQQVIV